MPWELNCIFTVHYQPRLFCGIPRQENGCHVVREQKEREQKEQQKLQHKHQEPAGTKLGNILGVKQRKKIKTFHVRTLLLKKKTEKKMK